MVLAHHNSRLRASTILLFVVAILLLAGDIALVLLGMQTIL